jgi:hypothetical protein
MIKKRWEINPLKWCDFIILHKDSLIKIVSVDELLEKEIVIEKMKIKQTNYSFGEYISFKPYGENQPDLQFTINKKVFDSIYATHIKFVLSNNL